ncbi:L-threonylcarbamoyladenylate synthase [Luteimonas cucumeris]|uniref:Threonylcarbamoyl-AMP synthase n=1 Tax=Luteimonas cucumeris TaxID=985012 RepID=A0A562L2D0_9GAMM|nr:Sua5/YciO/YrdC/YwlC family protein [Luteimonas cucumeris]TWI01676.1 L-threonylcarbamoyladenylate synthase [Luteimonas cucumeris]
MSQSLSLADAATAFMNGSILAYPTEAVWGLGCDPRNEAAVLRLLAIKQRPLDKGLILIAAHLDQLRPFLDLSALPAERLAEVLASWPGAHTWAMPASANAPRWITGAHDGIAVRVSAHPLVIALCDAFCGALVSTSANPGGEAPPRALSEFDPALLASIDGIVDGDTGGLARPTPIRDALTGAELRV